MVQHNVQGIVHCCVTPGNVLLRSDGSVCLTDFFDALDLREEDPLFERVGSLDYMPPEMIALPTPEEIRSGLDLSGRPRSFGPPVDIWQVRAGHSLLRVCLLDVGGSKTGLL